MPAELLNTASNITRKFYIVAVHNGEVKNIEAELNGNILTFETDSFSTYALAYTDTITESKENNLSNPRTGDNIALWIGLVLISMIGIVGTKILTSKKRRGSKH